MEPRVGSLLPLLLGSSETASGTELHPHRRTKNAAEMSLIPAPSMGPAAPVLWGREGAGSSGSPGKTLLDIAFPRPLRAMPWKAAGLHSLSFSLSLGQQGLTQMGLK